MFDQYGYQPAPTLTEAIEDLRPIYQEHFPMLTDQVITESANRVLVRDGQITNDVSRGAVVSGSLAMWMIYIHNFKKRLIDNGL